MVFHSACLKSRPTEPLPKISRKLSRPIAGRRGEAGLGRPLVERQPHRQRDWDEDEQRDQPDARGKESDSGGAVSEFISTAGKVGAGIPSHARAEA